MVKQVLKFFKIDFAHLTAHIDHLMGCMYSEGKNQLNQPEHV